MTAPAPAAARPPLLPCFLLGWGLGALGLLLVRQVGLALLEGPCQGRTVLALLVPLVLGPGGLAFTASNWGHPRRAALGLGLVVASLFPALAVGARDIGVLRSTGCAGGYVVVTRPDGRSAAEVTVRAGESLDLTARIGGYTPQSHPGPFALRTQSSAPGLSLTLARREAPAGQPFALRLTVVPGTPPNTYTVGVQGVQESGAQAVEATGSLDVIVRP